MTPMARLIVGAVALLLLAAVPLRLVQGTGSVAPGYASYASYAGYAIVQRAYAVARVVQPGDGPLWTTERTTLFLIHGLLRQVPMPRPRPRQPVADYVLTDTVAAHTGSGGLAVMGGPPPAPVSALSLLGVARLQPLLLHRPDNPVRGRPATHRVVGAGGVPNGCARTRSPWSLASGGA